jgi:hypothetical protein
MFVLYEGATPNYSQVCRNHLVPKNQINTRVNINTQHVYYEPEEHLLSHDNT